jgi:hypothetical protein
MEYYHHEFTHKLTPGRKRPPKKEVHFTVEVATTTDTSLIITEDEAPSTDGTSK